MNLNVQSLIAPMIEVHKSLENQTLKWRLEQLDALLLMIDENEEDFKDAIYQDLRKDKTEFEYCEILCVREEIRMFKKHLKHWMKPKQVPSVGALAPCFCEVRSVPLSEPGCLVIAPFNYPFSLSLLPAIGAIGSGNPCILKPSELVPTLSSLFAKLVPKYFAQGVFQVVEGGAAETTELMNHHWGMCFFTGSERVGKIIQEKAARTLTPTILELGGKAPVIIAEDCPDAMDVVCNRVMGSKLMNCGQTCISPDYILCHESKIESFREEVVKAIERLFGKNPQRSELGRIVTEKHAQRLIGMIKECEREGEVIYGGTKSDKEDKSSHLLDKKYVPPTLVLDPPITCKVMQEEIFGPILPIFPYETDEDAINFINQRGCSPLALYVFTKSNHRYEKFVSRCPSGAASRNDALVHFIIPEFPFGGIGNSGIGTYRGKQSFEVFSHKKTSLYHPCHPAFEYFGIRYHPHGNGNKSKILLSLLKYLPHIPVLPRKMIAFGVATGAFALSKRNLKNQMLLFSAHVLEAMASYLRKNCSE